jgi:hypothetical protein
MANIADDPQDFCAHSEVEFTVDGDVLVLASAGDWTVSSSALFLLRTLWQSHTKQNPVGEHLFPCCGHSMYVVDGQDDVAVLGCPNGIDFEVIRSLDDVIITSADRQKHRVSFAEWRDAVCAFSDAVRCFYAKCAPKQPSYDVKGFEKFMAEWERRRSSADGLS